MDEGGGGPSPAQLRAQDQLFLVGSMWWLDDLPTLDGHLARSTEVIDDLVPQRLLMARAQASWRAAHGEV